VGLSIGKRFHVIVDGDGEHLGLARDIAADHQHNAKFPQGVGKSQRGGGNESRPGQWQHDGKEPIQGRGPQGAGGFHGAPVDSGKGVLQRLHHKWHGIEHGADNQPGEGKRQSGAPQGDPAGAQNPLGGEGNQQIEAEHGRGQYQRQGDDGLHQCA